MEQGMGCMHLKLLSHMLPPLRGKNMTQSAIVV